MMRKLGRVVELYLPNGKELTKVGFKIQIDNEIIDVVQRQNMDNAKIYRDDFVYVEIINNDNQIIYNIESIKNLELGDELDD